MPKITIVGTTCKIEKSKTDAVAFSTNDVRRVDLFTQSFNHQDTDFKRTTLTVQFIGSKSPVTVIDVVTDAEESVELRKGFDAISKAMP